MAILARLLVPEDFGLVAMATAFTAVVDGFRDLGLRTATIQRQEISHQQISNLFWINAAAGIGFTLLFWSFAPTIGSFYGDERVVPITAAIAIAFIWSGFSVQHEALIGRQLRQGELALIGVAANAITVAAAIGGALAGLGYWALVLRDVLRSALMAGAVWARCPWIPAWPRRNSGTTDLVRIGRDLSVIQVLYVIVANADRIVLGKLFGASIVGQYRMAQQLILAPIEQLDAPIGSVATPALSMLQKDPERYARYYRKMVAFIGLGTMPVAAFGIVYAEELTRVVLGESWRGAEIYIRIFAAFRIHQTRTGNGRIGVAQPRPNTEVGCNDGCQQRYVPDVASHSAPTWGHKAWHSLTSLPPHCCSFRTYCSHSQIVRFELECSSKPCVARR